MCGSEAVAEVRARSDLHAYTESRLAAGGGLVPTVRKKLKTSGKLSIARCVELLKLPHVPFWIGCLFAKGFCRWTVMFLNVLAATRDSSKAFMVASVR